MHFLQKELEVNKELFAAVNSVGEEAASNKVKQGLILDLNPLWLAAFRLWDSGLDPFFFRRGPWFEFGWPGREWLSRFDVGRLPDLSRHFPEIDDFFEHFYHRSVPTHMQPYILRLAAKPSFPSGLDEDPNEISYDDERYRLIQIAREARILTVVETHPPPSLLFAPGSRIKSTIGFDGTLGGYVKDGNTNSILGMTCGHVLTTSALNASGQQIGNVVHSQKPVPLPANIKCSQNCGHMTDLDVALVDTHNSAPNVASSVATVVGNGQLVDMDGATTGGTQTYEIGGHVVEYEIGGSCWRKLLQFHAPIAGITPVSFNVATTALPKDGDSGAWLIRNSSEWAGMVVASNNLFGFALSATTLIKESNAHFGTNLSLA